ncbi:MAG: VCBS repeat-containing protein, partial [Candidatus Omnitrophica bacterium]|nr:VCBS repeat-containing protein [Candidatus Omnitrophota bacterium]
MNSYVRTAFILCAFYVSLMISQSYEVQASSLSTSSQSTTHSSSSKTTADKSSTTDPAQTPTQDTAKSATTPAPKAASAGVAASGVGANVQASSVQVEPFTGSANLSIPISVPPGRGGIQPNIAVSYSSSNRQLGIAGVGWSLDLGSIQRSTKKGVPSYNDSTDIFTLFQGASQDLVADSSTSGLYHLEVEGSFARIQYISHYWLVTDKKGIKYYFGNTDDSRQYDPANTSHIFRWALNRVEDLNGNYMTVTYTKDNGQLYPLSIAYTGNSQQALNPYASVDMSYVAASQKGVSYLAGFNITTAKRIDHITVSVNSHNQATYNFTYKQSAYSKKDLLQSVSQLGSDGTTALPPVTLSYTDTAAKGFQLDTSWDLSGVPFFTVNSGRWVDLGVRIADLNGDGYPDFVRDDFNCSGTYTNQVYLNNKHKAWNSSSGWQSNLNPPYGLPRGFVGNCPEIDRYNGLILADMDGDGLPDVVKNYRRDMYWGGQYVKDAKTNNGTDSFTQDDAWTLPNDALINYELGQPVYGYTVPGATGFGDINGDGYPDIAVSRTDWYPSHLVYFNSKGLNAATKGWTQSSQYSTPSDIDFNKGAALVDLNGDGLADIIYLKGGSCRVFLNTGSGWQEISGGYANTSGLGDLTNGTTEFIDVNGDGLVDIVMGTGNDSSSHVLMNTGNGWVQDDNWVPHGANFVNLSTQFLDANADGMVGYLIAVQGQTTQLYMNQGKPADLLNHIDNGIGGTTDIVYDSSAHYQNKFMPFIEQVVKSVTVSDAFTHSYTTNYSYANGNWDASYREFQGFGNVTVTDANGNYTTTTFLQDHWLKGRPSEQDTFDAQGKMYAKSVNQWQTQNLWSNSATNQTSKFVYLSRTDSYLYDGTATAKRTAQEITYGENPQYGDPTLTINYGEVDAVTGSDIATDKLTSTVSYVNN